MTFLYREDNNKPIYLFTQERKKSMCFPCSYWSDPFLIPEWVVWQLSLPPKNLSETETFITHPVLWCMCFLLVRVLLFPGDSHAAQRPPLHICHTAANFYWLHSSAHDTTGCYLATEVRGIGFWLASCSSYCAKHSAWHANSESRGHFKFSERFNKATTYCIVTSIALTLICYPAGNLVAAYNRFFFLWSRRSMDICPYSTYWFILFLF